MATTSQVVSVSTAAPVNETQTVNPNATGGTYTLTPNGLTPTTDLGPNDSAATVQAALEVVLGSGNIGVSRGGSANNYTYTLTYQGALAGTNVAQVTSTASLTGGTGVVTIATTQAGSPRTSPQQLDIDPSTGLRWGLGCLRGLFQ